MKCSPHATLGIVLCIILCLVLVSGCTFLQPPKSNATAASSPPADVSLPATTPIAVENAGGACAEGQTTCAGACRNTLVDSSNCGRCANVCGSDQYCNNGVCAAGTMNVPTTRIPSSITNAGGACAEGQMTCAGACRNVLADAGNCGRCGNVCGSGRTCSNGACSGGSTAGTVTTPVTTLPAPLPGSAAVVTTTTTPWPACPSGTIRCGGSCFDQNTDNSNCGGCGNGCRYGKICVSGVCSCPAGLTVCGYYCFNTNTDTNNCGSCGNVCPAGMICSSGSCGSSSCSQTLCGVNCVNTETDRNNCGRCGTTCPAGTHCSGGICTCNVGIACGGACTNTATNNYHCGACWVACSGDQTCVAGVCTAPTTDLCPKGQTLCSGGKSGSVCTDLNTDDYNCGSCGHVCTGGTLCSGGICGFVIK